MASEPCQVMARTGVYLTAIQMEHVANGVKTTIELDFERQINVIVTDDSEARARLAEFAAAAGLPNLNGGNSYGLATDGEILSP